MGLVERTAFLARRLAVRTEAGRARPLWRWIYELLARGIGLALTAGQRDAEVYVAASVATGDPVYGLSDIDLVVVAADARRVRRRWDTLRRRLGPLGPLFSDLAAYTPAELEAAARQSTFTHTGEAVYLGERWARDERGLRERPGLSGATRDWRPLRGADRRPSAASATADGQRLRIAAWLELQFWWREAMRLATRPGDQLAPYTCLKLVTESARVWLALEHAQQPASRQAVLEQTLERLPHEESLCRALTLRATLARSEPAPWDELLPLFARLSGRVAESFEAAAEGTGRVDVRLSGLPIDGRVPLLDWRGLVLPRLPDDTLAPMAGDPGHLPTLAAAVQASADRRYSALRTDALLVLAARAPWTRSFLRAVACRATDPVSFALLDGSSTARFPRLAGWSVDDLARRAVGEHRAWLCCAPADGTLDGRAWLDGRQAGASAAVRVAAKLLTAARAAVLYETLAERSPELGLDLQAVAAALGRRHPTAHGAAEEVSGAYARGGLIDPAALRTLRAQLLASPAYRPADQDRRRSVTSAVPA